MKKMLSISALFSLITLNYSATLTPSRAYQWGFEEGNLISNWSFEKPLAFWDDYSASGLTVTPRFKSTANSGSFVAEVSGTYAPGTSGTQDQLFLQTPLFRAQPYTSYTLSFYYRNSTVTGQINPAIRFWRSLYEDALISTLKGSSYTANSSWKLYVLNFDNPSNSNYLQIALAECLSSTGGTYYFDDVILEEGTFNATEIAERRKRIPETVSFGDGFGRAVQTQSKIFPLNGQYLVQGTGVDNFARPETTFLATPVTMSSPSYQTSLFSKAKSYYGSSGPFNAHNMPFSQVKYADEPSPRVIESGSPDTAFQIGKHSSKAGYYFVADTSFPVDIENPVIINRPCKYRLDWSKNPDSFYFLTWTNLLGQVVRKANTKSSTLSENPLGTPYWQWAITEFKYDMFGNVIKTLTPIDVNAKNTNLAEINAYNALGQIISTMAPDRNQTMYWYNRAGQIRYSQNEVQRPQNNYSYFEYDSQGRLLSEGEQNLSAAPPQDSVDKDTYKPASKEEFIGYIYDDTASFTARTGFTLDEIMGYWKYSIEVNNSPHRLFAKYHTNNRCGATNLGAIGRIVIDFYTYDEKGRISISWKYMGAISDPNCPRPISYHTPSRIKLVRQTVLIRLITAIRLYIGEPKSSYFL